MKILKLNPMNPLFYMNNAKINALFHVADFDECAAGSDGCSQTCTNVDGGFNCGCEFGFSLGDDRKSCQKGT